MIDRNTEVVPAARTTLTRDMVMECVNIIGKAMFGVNEELGIIGLGFA
jgi:hypothetical protein